MKLYVCKAGILHVPDKNTITPGVDVGKAFDMLSFYNIIDHPEGVVLVDCGMDDRFGGEPIEGADPVSSLTELGYSPDDVRYVVLTHMHFDHIAHLNEFPQATVVVRQDELDAAYDDDAPDHIGYMHDQFECLADQECIALDPKIDYDLFGDGSVVIFDTPGHTRGHQSVVLTFEDGSHAVLTGDASSIQQNLDEMIPSGTPDHAAISMESLKKVKAFQDKGYKLFLPHEPHQDVKLCPDFYEGV